MFQESGRTGRWQRTVPHRVEAADVALDFAAAISPFPRSCRCSTWELSGAGTRSVPDDAALIVSELVTNAIRYGNGHRIVLRIALRARELRIEVADGTPGRAVARQAGDDEESGRGLLLVAALAREWGTSPGGETTWCTLALPAADPEAAPEAQAQAQAQAPAPAPAPAPDDPAHRPAR
ncbi:ATP-binding protein [Streptomyces sp. NPDC003691]